MDANGGYFDEELYASGQSRRIDPDESMRKRERLSEKILEGASVRVSDYTGGVRRDGDKLFGGWYLDAAYNTQFANASGVVTLRDGTRRTLDIPKGAMRILMEK